MIPENTKYCFLENVYSTNGQTEYYEFIFISSTYVTSLLKIVSAEIHSLYAECLEKNIIIDFSLSDGYLRCNNVHEISSSVIDKNDVGHIIYSKPETYTFFQFVRDAIDHNFIYVANKNILQEGDNIISKEIKSFTDLKISESTLSVYFNVVNDTEVYNSTLISVEDNVRVHDIYYGVPEGCSNPLEYAELICSLTINNVTYSIYYTDFIPLYDVSTIITPAAINKAACIRDYNKIISNMLLQYQGMLFESTARKFPALTWTGSSKSYNKCYGAKVMTSVPKISKACCKEYLTTILSEIQQGKESGIPILELLKKYKFVEPVLACAVYLEEAIKEHNESISDHIMYVSEIIEQLKKDSLYANLYLYNIRTLSYLKALYIMDNKYSATFYGGNEPYFTIVEEGLQYGQ